MKQNKLFQLNFVNAWQFPLISACTSSQLSLQTIARNGRQLKFDCKTTNFKTCDNTGDIPHFWSLTVLSKTSSRYRRHSESRIAGKLVWISRYTQIDMGEKEPTVL